MKNEQLIQELINAGYLKTPRIIEAFLKIDRYDFVIDYLKTDAYLNAPLAIGFGQTISQPLTVAFMLELLQPEEGNKVLDIGSGSGWTTALLAYLVGEKGKVYGIEIIPELCEFGKRNVAKYNFLKKGIVEIICGNGYPGLKEEAPFDRILSSAASEEIPSSWKEQLKVGGRMVLPMNQSLFLVIKKTEEEFEIKEYPGFIFVPLKKS